MADGGKQFETSLRQAEGALKMIDFTKKTVASNEKNVQDSIQGVPGAEPVAEAEKKLAATHDLLAANTVAAQQKLNACMMGYDLAKRTLAEPMKERYQKLLENAKPQGLSVI